MLAEKSVIRIIAMREQAAVAERSLFIVNSIVGFKKTGWKNSSNLFLEYL